MKKGFSVVEVLVVAAILLTVTVSVSQIFPRFIVSFREASPVAKANYFLEEGVEVVKIFRAESWSKNISTLQNNTPYRISFDAGNMTWATTSSTELIDGKFDRVIILSEVYRDENGRIASSGNVDVDSRKVDVNVSWQATSGTTTKTLTTYMFNSLNN